MDADRKAALRVDAQRRRRQPAALRLLAQRQDVALLFQLADDGRDGLDRQSDALRRCRRAWSGRAGGSNSSTMRRLYGRPNSWFVPRSATLARPQTASFAPGYLFSQMDFKNKRSDLAAIEHPAHAAANLDRVRRRAIVRSCPSTAPPMRPPSSSSICKPTCSTAPTQPPIHDAAGLVARARAVMEWARGTGRPVAFVRHDGPQGDTLAPGAPGWPVWPALGQAEDEPTFAKSVGDAFSNPDFGQWVADQGAGEIVLLGAQTDHCVAATVNGRHRGRAQGDGGSDAHSTWGMPSETAEQIIARHNAAFADAGANLVSTKSLTET